MPTQAGLTNIQVTMETRRELRILKATYGLKSYDELLNILIEKVKE